MKKETENIIEIGSGEGYGSGENVDPVKEEVKDLEQVQESSFDEIGVTKNKLKKRVSVNLSAARQGIIFSEILGKPLSKRRR